MKDACLLTIKLVLARRLKQYFL